MLKAKDSRRDVPLTVAKPVKPRNWSVGNMRARGRSIYLTQSTHYSFPGTNIDYCL
jgi:hypothetical protein